MRKLRRVVAAPSDLGTDVIGVPQGSDLELDLRLEAVMEGVLVSGTARGRAAGECVRCLEPITDPDVVEVDARFQELFVYDDEAHRGQDDDADDGTRRMEGDLLDLEPVLRDAVVIGLPFQPLCREDCPGLCVECGARLADDPDHHHDEPVDPRWSALTALRPDGD